MLLLFGLFILRNALQIEECWDGDGLLSLWAERHRKSRNGLGILIRMAVIEGLEIGSDNTPFRETLYFRSGCA